MNYDYYTTGYYNPDGLFGAIAGALVFISLISLALAIFGIIVMWKIFKKAGKEGWIAIIPLYNVYTLFEITWGNGWYFLLLLTAIIPVLGWIACIVITIMTMIKLAKAFGKDSGFAVGLVLLSVIFLAILAFDKSTYLGAPTKEDQNIQPAGPTPNQNNSFNQQNISPSNTTLEENTNQFQYNAESTQLNNATASEQPVVTPTLSDQSNETQTVIQSVNEQVNPVPPVIEPTKQPSFCTNCGAQLPEGTIFCPNCGTPKAS